MIADLSGRKALVTGAGTSGRLGKIKCAVAKQRQPYDARASVAGAECHALAGTRLVLWLGCRNLVR